MHPGRISIYLFICTVFVVLCSLSTSWDLFRVTRLGGIFASATKQSWRSWQVLSKSQAIFCNLCKQTNATYPFTLISDSTFSILLHPQVKSISLPLIGFWCVTVNTASMDCYFSFSVYTAALAIWKSSQLLLISLHIFVKTPHRCSLL